MNFTEEVNLLLVGAGIALVSALVSGIGSFFVAEYRERKRRIEAKKELAARLSGQVFALSATDPNSIPISGLLDTWKEYEEILDRDSSISTEIHHDLLIGTMEVLIRQEHAMRDVDRKSN